MAVEPRSPEPTNLAVVIRQQAWFRPSVDLEGLEPFPINKIDAVGVLPVNVFRVRTLIGRGPVDRKRFPELMLWFDEGAISYPVFQCPGVGTNGGAMMLSAKPRALTASANEALTLIEISLTVPVTGSFRTECQSTAPSMTPTGPSALINRWLSDARMWLEQAIGLYALYEYPIVWEPLGGEHSVSFVDFGAKKIDSSTPTNYGTFMPFRLKVAPRVRDGELADDGLAEFAQLQGTTLHFPLLLLQRALWQKNVQLRFLETFLLLDYLTSQSKAPDPLRGEREELYGRLEQCIDNAHPEHVKRIKALKHIILQPSLRERLRSYLLQLGVEHDENALGDMLRIRNDLAHARPVNDDKLNTVETIARLLAMEALRLELAKEGITFRDAPAKLSRLLSALTGGGGSSST